ncbi:MAG: SEC-C domain-containing protein [Bacilli bacterium]|nr:SEC-C domain-containing protein [Bacilli bacterium]
MPCCSGRKYKQCCGKQSRKASKIKAYGIFLLHVLIKICKNG